MLHLSPIFLVVYSGERGVGDQLEKNNTQTAAGLQVFITHGK